MTHRPIAEVQVCVCSLKVGDTIFEDHTAHNIYAIHGLARGYALIFETRQPMVLLSTDFVTIGHTVARAVTSE
jgi:hypothetical protein